MAYPHQTQQNYVANPSIPYVGTIPNGVQPGSMIYIQGFVPAGAQRFHINLQCAAPPAPQSDVALHFNPRFPAQVVVRNALKAKKWLGEEKDQPYFPFAYNTPFEIIILVEQNQFKVAVNGNHFAQFSHRVINLKRITHMRIEGQVQIYSIRYERGAAPAPAPAAVTAPILNPPIPYNALIPGGVQPGKRIYVDGLVPAGAQRFHINLKCNALEPPQSDVALHFNPRFPAQVVVRNAMKGQKWLTEERGQPYFPFVYNVPFNIVISTEQKQFKIAVNGNHFAEFQHRVVNLKRITHLSIHGQVQIYSIRYEGGAGGPPAPAAAPPMPAMPQPALQNVVMNPPVPYIAPIAGGMTPGKMIFISGIVNPNPERFHVNLQCGPRTQPRANVAFHFNPRFQTRKIHRNTLLNQNWGAVENNTPNFPFIPNSFFEIIVLCQHDAYRVAVNGQHLLEYPHRIAFNQVTFLEIDGAVRLTQVRLQ